MKKLMIYAWLVILITAIVALFWYNEWIYSRPTPVPPNYHPVSIGQIVKINVPKRIDGKQPLFLHFYNPRCPCSRFNVQSFKALVKLYSHQLNFVIVVMSDGNYTEKDIQNKFDTNTPVLFDKSIAIACGVYSTPQAVILDAKHQLYYRGNYNSARYCTNEQTSYAKIAIKGLLANNTQLLFNQLALRAYGCQLPNCTR